MYERNYITEKECAAGATSDLVPNTDWGQDKTVKDMELKDAEFLDADTPVGKVMERCYQSATHSTL